MIKRQLLGFAFVGGTAFLIDAGIAQAAVSLLGLDPYTARALSFPPAVVYNWWMNRCLSFAMPTPPTLSEFLQFITSASAGLALNWGIYVGVLWLLPWSHAWPALAQVPATGIAMVFNFVMMRWVIFAGPRQEEENKGEHPSEETRP